MNEQRQERSSLPSQKSSSGSGVGIVAMLLGVCSIVIPIVASSHLSAGSQFLIMCFGGAFLIVGVTVMTISKLYVKASSSLAFVRTGMWGEKPIAKGGALVIPVVHNIVYVLLETMKLKVPRTGQSALITGDHLRVDVEAEFYIKVQKETVDILAAATSLGGKSVTPEHIKDLVFEKLVSVLRTVAAQKTLIELHKERKDFAAAVKSELSEDLKNNGLTLESVTISKLDQTPLAEMDENNIFDAKGAKAISKTVMAERVERIQIEKDADEKIKAQEVKTAKAILARDTEKAQAVAERELEISRTRSETEQQAASFAADQQKITETAAIESAKAVALAKVDQEKSLELANKNKEREVQEADILKDKAVEIAGQDKEISVTKKHQEHLAAQSDQLDVEAVRIKKEQEVKTIEAVKSAERRKEETLINERGLVEKDKIRENMQVDVKAYETTKTAEAEFEASSKKAESVKIEAKAKKDADVLAAEGKLANDMIPVNVAKAEVAVQAERVVVLKDELTAKSEHAEISKELEIELATIEARKDVDIERAKAAGIALSHTEMKIYGDPNAVASMMDALTSGHKIGAFAEGLLETTPKPIKEIAAKSLAGLGDMASNMLEKLTGQKIKGDDIEKFLKANKGE